MADTLDLAADADDQQLLAQIVDYYHRSLKASREALDYLRQRGITNGQTIDYFRIGYADRTLGLKLPSKQVKAGKEIRSRLERLGLFRASGHEHFTGSVVFPILAADGTRQIVDMYGRKILAPNSARERPCIPTCPRSDTAFGMSKRSGQPRKSSCARRFSTLSRFGTTATEALPVCLGRMP